MMKGDGTPLQESPPSLGGVRVGLQLGRYELLHEIATGGMATVYLARARSVAGFERVVAIKVCHPHLRHEEEFSSMFLDEARLAARIHHPNVVSTLDVGEAEQLYLVMEYIEGDRISGLIKAAARRGERVPVPITLRIMIDVLSGLHAAHELKDHQGHPLNIVHRDVSPQNILVGVDGVTRITDFGIAKAEARLTVTREGQVKGKMSYMAPEQLSSTNVNRRADVYAAGVVLWEALTGRRLFRADTEAETLNLVLHGVVLAPSTVAPEIVPEVDAVLRKALERDPDKRFQSAAEFADALENLDVLKVATTRAVAAYICELLAEPIQKRRELVRKFSEGAPLPLPVEHSGVRATSDIQNPFAHGGSTRTNVPPLPGALSAPMLPTPVAGDASVLEIEPEDPTSSRALRRRGRRAPAPRRRRPGARRDAQRPRTSVNAPPPGTNAVLRAAPPTPAPPTPAPPVAQPAPETQPAVVAQPAPETQPAVVAETQPAQTDDQAQPRGHHPPRAPRAPRAPRVGAGHAETTPALPPAQPQQGGGEFRPSGI
ncbi:MAG: serine/threonine-protein kinase [Polyangiales bacterium]